MIQIHKSNRPPTKLLGNPAKKALKSLWDAHRSGEDFDFKSSVYAAKSVKNALIAAQAGKCAFCESKILHIGYGDVEHFRPKGGWVQHAGDKLSKPGYFWLAYEWSNLFLSCQLCNQSFKKNKFPLFNPRQRSTPKSPETAKEKPKFISPSENGETFIQFKADIPIGIDQKGRGETTITELRIDRPELNDRRFDYLCKLKYAYVLATESTGPLAKEASQVLDDAILESAEYSSAVRCAIKNRFEGIPR